MKTEIGIVGEGALSPVVLSPQGVEPSAVSFREVGGDRYPVFPLCDSDDRYVARLREDPRYARYDKAALMAIGAALKAAGDGEWNGDGITGLCIGTARGSTGAFEYHHRNFLTEGGAALKPYTSPTTTGGSVTSPVALALGCNGPVASLSMTCSSGLYAIAQGVAFLRAGMAERFFVGGTEAPLTPFTLAQMGILRIYSKDGETRYPCRPLSLEAKNSLTLGEGAAVFCLERVERSREVPKIVGVGFGAELHQSATGMSREGIPFQQSMSGALRALKELRGETAIDLIVMHAPGTVQGDSSELAALNALFGEIPPITTTKFLTGHTFGASGPLGVLFALFFLQGGFVPPFPYDLRINPRKAPDRIRRVMINSAGFGGNAVSIIIEGG